LDVSLAASHDLLFTHRALLSEYSCMEGAPSG